MLRSLAFWGVVAQHILGAWARRGSLGLKSMALISACFELVRFAVPLFVFMFGMMLARGMERFSAGRYYLKRARQILLPYIVWSCIYVYYYGSGAGPAELARLLLTGGAQYHLWYVPLIMQFVLLAPLFVWLFRRAEAARRPMRAWALLIGLSFLPLLALPLIKAPGLTSVSCPIITGPVIEAVGAMEADFAIQMPSPLLSYISGSNVGPRFKTNSFIRGSISQGYSASSNKGAARVWERSYISLIFICFFLS